jgi:hypothetical protein
VKQDGSKVWYFPDGELPEPNDPLHIAHESLMILNPTEGEASIKITFYWEAKDPDKEVVVQVGGERVRCLRLDRPEEIGGVKIPHRTQYAMKLVSDKPIIVQYGRLDTTQANYELYTTMGFHRRE